MKKFLIWTIVIVIIVAISIFYHKTGDEQNDDIKNNLSGEIKEELFSGESVISGDEVEDIVKSGEIVDNDDEINEDNKEDGDARNIRSDFRFL